MKTITAPRHSRSTSAFIFCSVMATAMIISNTCAAFAESPAVPDISLVPNADSNVAKTKTSSDSANTYQKPAEWRYLNEQERLVDGIGRDIAEILGYAKYNRNENGFARGEVNLSTKTQDLNAGTYLYSVTIGKNHPSFDYSLTLVDFIWSPKTYEPFARTILHSFELQPSPASQIPSEFLNNIAKAERKLLFLENERISEALSQNPLDASLHEQAALLLGVFSSLEISGSFFDNRSLLSRMTAHLTLASALNQGKQGIVGRMANAILESLSGRKRIASDVIRQIDSQNPNPTERSISRAIKMGINSDFRVYNEADSTPLEDLISCQFYALSHPIEDVLKRFATHVSPLSHQWRTMFSAARLSVASGSLIQTKMISSAVAEFIECRNAYKKVHDDNFSSFCEELNLQPSGCLSNKGEVPTLNVLSWELVCSFFQRQFAYAILLEYQYYKWSLHVNDVAAKVKEGIDKNFYKLTFFPFIADRFILKGYERRYVYSAINKLFKERPEIIPLGIWKLSVPMAAKNGTVLSPPAEAWFDPAIPMGTALVERTDMKNCPKTLPFYERLRRLNPYESYLAYAWAREKYGEFPTAEQYREAFGPLSEYDQRAISLICRGEIYNPEKFVVLAEKIAQGDPSVYFDAADYCVINNMPKKAVEFYEKAFKSVPNQIAVANNSDWLVQYLYSTGEKSKAEQLAESAAAVYSRRGIQTLGRLLERQGKLNDAEAQYKAIKERYDNVSPLLSFYLRNSEKDPRFKQAADELLPEIFPAGLQRVGLASFSGVPDRAIIVQSTWWISDSPLKWDTIIVGINGYAVTSAAQYDVVKELADQKTCSVIYWDGEAFRERTEPTVHHNSLGVSIREYKKPK